MAAQNNDPTNSYGSLPQDPLTNTNNDEEEEHSDPQLLNGKESWNYPRKNIAKTLSMFLGMIVFGMNDASLGVLVKSVSN